MLYWMPNWMRFVLFVIGVFVLGFIFRFIGRFPVAALIIIACAVAFLIIFHVNRSKKSRKLKDTAADDAASAEPYQMLKRMMERAPSTSCSPKDGQSFRADAEVKSCVEDVGASGGCVTVSFSDGFSYKSYYTNSSGYRVPVSDSFSYKSYYVSGSGNRSSLSDSSKKNIICEAILEHNRLLCEAHPEFDVNELNREAAIYLMEAKGWGRKHVCSVCGNTYIKISAFTPCPFCALNAKGNNNQTPSVLEQINRIPMAVEPTVKAEDPKPSPAPAPMDADAWRAEVHRQAEQRAQEDKQRKAAEKTTQDDVQTLSEHIEWAAWAKDKSNHEKLQELCGVKLVHTETQGMLHEFTAYSYTLGPKGWDDIKRIMATIVDSDRGKSQGKISFATYLESGSLGSNTASERISIPEEKKASEMDIKLEENSWMRLSMDGGSISMRCPIRLLIYNQTGQAALQVAFTQKAPEEFTLYLCGVLAATFGIAGKAPSGDVEQGINAVIEYIDGQSEYTERTDCTDLAQSADGEQKEPVQPGPAVSPASASNQTPASADETEPEAVRILRDKICRELRDDSYLFDAKGSYRLELLEGEKQRYFKDCPGFGYWPGASFELNLKTGKLWVDLFTYPEPLHGIDAREIYCPISAERFHEIAVECGMSPELQWFRTEEDWARLFDNRLQSVIDKALHRSEKRKAKEKEERRQRNGVELSSEYWTQTPGMWIESVRIWFMWVSGSSRGISLTKENGTYYLEGQALSSAEAVWVERQVEAALESHDNSTWSSGDRISVTIRTSRWTNVEIKREAVLTKYYDLLSQLQRLQYYGSKDMRSQHGDK